jgi:EAL domain-containing protein (putative c-di-GMP-specific phosphodiesterase class I)
LKIDKTFIGKMMIDSDFLGIVKAIISMSKSLKLKTIAEGVEFEEERKILRDLGCDILQGFYFSKPVDKEELLQMLEKNSDSRTLVLK